jgi:hypothetical protein
MRASFHVAIWSIGALAIGCESQGSEYSAAVSLQSRAEEQREMRDEMELSAGSGAEEDEPVDDDTARMAEADEVEPDASIEEQVAEEESWADDSHLCGNGELDLGERCDIGIEEGEGLCPHRCDPEPGCPDETLVVRGCGTYCMPEAAPSEACQAN